MASKRRQPLIQEREDQHKRLRSRVECPVCCEVPTSGPLPVCRNGHTTCPQCKSDSCRVAMTDAVSLLASSIIENIDHKCPHEGCSHPMLPLEQLNTHKAECSYRPIVCPGAEELCGKKVAACLLLDHLLNHCKGSKPKGADVPHKDHAQKKKKVLMLKYSSVDLLNLLTNQNQKGRVITWKAQKYYLKYRTTEGGQNGNVECAVIDLDYEAPATEPKPTAKLVLHKVGDPNFNEGKTEIIRSVTSIDQHVDSDGFVFARKNVRMSASLTGRKWEVALDFSM